jgi:hypothetical protein
MPIILEYVKGQMYKIKIVIKAHITRLKGRIPLCCHPFAAYIR